MVYPSDFESKIGFDTIRHTLSSLCISRLGKQLVDELAFSSDRDLILHRLGCVVEMVDIRRSALPFPGLCPHDVIPYLNEIRALHSFMSASRLLHLLQMLSSFAEIRAFFDDARAEESDLPQFPHLSDTVASLADFPLLVSAISRVIDKFGEVKDNASPALYDIRRSMQRMQGSMQRAVHRVLDAAIASGIVDKDASPVVRDGRLVIPVAAGLKRQINGIVHDESATGKTVYIEPAEVVEAANRLRELQLEEKREITNILIGVADVLRPHVDDIAHGCQLIGQLDFISAKAALAIDLDAHLPHVEKEPLFEWYHAVHPALFLSLRQQGRKVVPLDINLDHDRRILIISGPNAGGKSVCLKTIAVVQYMLQCGLLPTLYDNSHVGIFDKILIDIGDEQSIENDLSTYSSHLRNMKFFLANASKRSLILADEMGSGTEPQIGGAMAQAILSKLGESECFGVVTTHYQNLKTFAEAAPGFVNGAMLYDRAHLEPTFQLAIGTPGSSFAIDIAHKMGLPLEVIEEAKNIVGSDYVNLDKYLSDIARDRKYWANKRLNIREKENKLDNLLSKYEEVAGDLKSQRKEILSDARREAQEILAGANARIERTILEIRKAQAEKERTKQLRQELREFTEVNQRQEASDGETERIKTLKHKSRKAKQNQQNRVVEATPKQVRPLAVGDYVQLDGAGSPGQIISITGKKAEVAFGALRTIVALSRLKPTKAPKPSATASASLGVVSSDDSRQRQLNFKTEIDVRGMRADEAIQAVTYFLDDAIQFNAGRVRILHGTGHGILKTLIRQQLKANPAIAGFADEDIRFGGAGITVVDLA